METHKIYILFQLFIKKANQQTIDNAMTIQMRVY
jgi:hypothetical protein